LIAKAFIKIKIAKTESKEGARERDW